MRHEEADAATELAGVDGRAGAAPCRRAGVESVAAAPAAEAAAAGIDMPVAPPKPPLREPPPKPVALGVLRRPPRLAEDACSALAAA